MTSIFAWNMRGFNKPCKQKAVQSWVKVAKLSLGCLVETKVREENFLGVFNATFPGWQCLHNYSHHRLGRIWVCWSDEVDVVPVLISGQMIMCWVRFKSTKDVFLASFVYASNCMIERRELWRDMDIISRSVASGINPWVIQGDFNVTLSAMEHSRFLDTAGESSAIREFQEAVRLCDFVDLSHSGPQYTWTNNQDANLISKKLDRVMGNSCWHTRFPQSHVAFEVGGVSDHSRMVTNLRLVTQGNTKPFKFFTHVATHPEFLEVVSHVWNSTPHLFHSRSALKRLQEKLKLLKSELRRLNRDMFGDLPARVKQAFDDLCVKQNNAMQNPQTSTFEEASDAWEHWHHLAGIEEQFFYQKSRIQWLGLGDRNTNFFHKTCQSRYARNAIRRLVTSDGLVLTDPGEIKAAAVSYYEEFMQGQSFDTVEASQEELEDILDFRCSQADAATLIAPVQDEEVRAALFSMPINKAPGPDGYPMEFYKTAWSVVGRDFTTAVQSFFLFSFMPRSTNATLLSLVPKTLTAEKMSDFRPIACCNVVYKVISRIMAKRLKNILPQAIELNKCAFVQGRWLLENVLLATEVVKDYHKPTISSRSAIKFDISKAFDTVKWSFVEVTLRAMNIPDQFVTWIMRCMDTASFSVSINGESEGFFPSSRGIRQGCSLSPYLYVIVSNVLSRLLNMAVLARSIGFHPMCQAVNLSHLSFADDIIVFTDGSPTSLRSTLDVF